MVDQQFFKSLMMTSSNPVGFTLIEICANLNEKNLCSQSSKLSFFALHFKAQNFIVRFKVEKMFLQLLFCSQPRTLKYLVQVSERISYTPSGLLMFLAYFLRVFKITCFRVYFNFNVKFKVTLSNSITTFERYCKAYKIVFH